MLRSEYYNLMRHLAHEKRLQYSLATRDISLSRVRQIYQEEGITIDPCTGKLRRLKAAYFNDDDGCSILINMSLPEEPRLFAMIHELKHHYLDQDKLRCFCHDVDEQSPMIEIGAEVFAAEFIFPEDEFRRYVAALGIKQPLTADQIVRLKYHSPARVSYQFIQKMLLRLGLMRSGQFTGVQFQKLYEMTYGSRYRRRPVQM